MPSGLEEKKVLLVFIICKGTGVFTLCTYPTSPGACYRRLRGSLSAPSNMFASPASIIPGIKDEAMRALEASLASSVEHRTVLETKLSASEQVLSAVRTKLNKSASEAREQRAALAERDETIAALKLKAQASEAESTQTRQRLVALRLAGQARQPKSARTRHNHTSIPTRARARTPEPFTEP